ncbi:MAG: hypothetical protein Q8L10_02295 [Candidatus Moranbacteria bacterium]|nr:hypothetical protein [Candidatus Moranbacteria bacterium]
MNVESIKKYIQDNPEIDQAKKEGYLKILSSPDVSKAEISEILDELEDAVQAKIDGVYADAGVVLDENSPEYKRQYQQMATEIDAAEKEFNSSMDEIDKEMNEVEEDTSQKIDDVKAQSIRDSIGI